MLVNGGYFVDNNKNDVPIAFYECLMDNIDEFSSYAGIVCIDIL